MSDVQGIDERNWILTLFIRDDGERFLLGDGAYEFKDSHLHFTADAITNDTVDVQGSDGILLAGQVRRPTTQSFDGYVGTATATKEQIEQKRRAFIGFFLPRHTYTAIYIFTNGKAIQRKRGFLVDYPEVKELFQIHPEYHVALNFEDVNYYNYSEDEEGKEVYSSIYELINTRATSGGLVWDEIGVVWDSGGGKNLLPYPYQGRKKASGITFTDNYDGSVSISGRNNGNGNSAFYFVWIGGGSEPLTLTAGTYAISGLIEGTEMTFYNGSRYYDISPASPTLTLAEDTTFQSVYLQIRKDDATTFNGETVKPMIEAGDTPTEYEPYVIGAVWESGSGETENNINVESIETVYPVLTIVGRATGITIENIRTGDTLEYLGTVSEGQTLVIDMGNQTAKLNGVNVLSNISGDWIRLASGLNRVLYDANVDEDSSATLEWQEIVA